MEPSAPDRERPFGVYCPKFDGTERLFSCHPTRAQADAVARSLRAVGCHAVVRAPDPQPARGAT
jgi:hypothetical protein